MNGPILVRAMALACVVGALLSGCGGEADGAGGAAAAPGSEAYLASIEGDLRQLLTPPSQGWPGPERAPRPTPGRNIAIISSSQASDGTSLAVGQAVEAVRALGWTAQVCDGRGDPAGYDQCVRSAVSANVAGIMAVSVPPALIRPALELARQRRIPFVSESDTSAADPLVAAVAPLPWAAQGAAVAKWIAKDSGGRAEVFVIRNDEFAGVKERSDALVAELRRCPGCRVLDEQQIVYTEALSPRIGQIIKAAGDRFGPRLRYVVSPYGATESFTVPALRALRRDDVKLADFESQAQQTRNCRNGDVDVLGASLVSWHAWAGVDQLLRVVEGAPPVDANYVPHFLATPQTCPAAGTVEDLARLDFRANYRRIWTGA
ncbi:sugar ABC transporter substrate-binding protein [Pseudonocardia acaciae]|uniref:sugar ABC transporter substrate-binding protein n=1 Tax=Pseudonocardia acaciae TaxID=551276 RepID=UPI0004909428|nr:substrate-binding domain-containing protein [Pseudonocardia acaciae]